MGRAVPGWGLVRTQEGVGPEGGDGFWFGLWFGFGLRRFAWRRDFIFIYEVGVELEGESCWKVYTEDQVRRRYAFYIELRTRIESRDGNCKVRSRSVRKQSIVEVWPQYYCVFFNLAVL